MKWLWWVLAAVVGVILLVGGRAVLIYRLGQKQKELLPKIKLYAERYGIDPYVLAALVAKESSFNPTAFRREAGYKWGTNPDFPEGGDASYGLTQIMYSNARALGYTGIPTGLFDPDMNLHFGTLFLKNLLTRYGNYRDALAAYNSGRAFDKAPESTRTDYVPKSEGYAEYFRQENVFA